MSLKVCGSGAALAGVLLAAWGYLHTRPDYTHVYWASDAVTVALSVFVPALLLLGFVGLHIRCEARVGALAKAGFDLGFLGSWVGVVRGLENASGWYDAYVLGYENSTSFGLLLPWWIEWLPFVFVGLSSVGITTVGTKTPRALSALPLIMGALGWAYYFTDSGGVVESRPAHVGFGILFSASWVVLGLMLWREGRRGGTTTPD
jgi:hypothetical protein